METVKSNAEKENNKHWFYALQQIRYFLYIETEKPAPLSNKRVFCLFVYMGVRGKSRVYCSLLAYCTARFGHSNFGHQMPPRLPTRSAL
jgi:hypothetical protein